MTISCSVCMTASAIASETDPAPGQTFWLCPACWTEYLHALDEATANSATQGAREPVPGGEWTCPTCHNRIEIAS